MNGPELKSNGSALKYLGNTGQKAHNKVSRLPNAELFPFLSRRLAASGVEIPGVSRLENEGETDDEEDEVDAAQAMLSLKHGPRVLSSKTGILKKINRIFSTSFFLHFIVSFIYLLFSYLL